jgi:small acid-soluble spore protein (thioredoxin-like protein)
LHNKLSITDNIIKIIGGSFMKNKPDDRRDNVEKIQNSIDHTIRNMEIANDMMDKIDNSKTKEELRAKNERREQALEDMREEIKDEANSRENGYKG